MGKNYRQHSDMCGCERCALQADRENPASVFDEYEDSEIMDCGCNVWRGCDCAYYSETETRDTEGPNV